MRVGDPTSEDIEIGPLIRSREVNRVNDWVVEARKAGAEILTGGVPLSDSCYSPTVIYNPPDEVRGNIQDTLNRNPILVTALNKVIGYEQGAAIAKRAYAEGRPVLDVAEELTDISRTELEALLDPAALTEYESSDSVVEFGRRIKNIRDDIHR